MNEVRTIERAEKLVKCGEEYLNEALQSCVNCIFEKEKDCFKKMAEETIKTIKELLAANQELESTLNGVMYFIDKSLNDKEKEKSEVERANILREKFKQLEEKQYYSFW